MLKNILITFLLLMAISSSKAQPIPFTPTGSSNSDTHFSRPLFRFGDSPTLIHLMPGIFYPIYRDAKRKSNAHLYIGSYLPPDEEATVLDSRLYRAIETDRITYEGIIKLKTMNAERFFSETGTWFSEYFRNSDGILSTLKKPGLIKGSYVIDHSQSDYAPAIGKKDPLKGEITFVIRDGIMQVMITNFRATQHGSAVPLETLLFKKKEKLKNESSEKLFNDLETNCVKIMNDLKASIEKSNR